eukprot:CAMPEP_0202957342 /NCGR_PEP_ID=MMETSP1396-20130829/1766_1 /ASSEMBLY_ACC=CAM_ASM_000872 /TAXON_ID= /ORGANISM="Pseudokeronopsis sp., Strain Brazil" /LENGTH=47 /DNA_ID= /DNA_START= /DNA_END= /DNA_ORIENTATION=
MKNEMQQQKHDKENSLVMPEVIVQSQVTMKAALKKKFEADILEEFRP